MGDTDNSYNTYITNNLSAIIENNRLQCTYYGTLYVGTIKEGSSFKNNILIRKSKNQSPVAKLSSLTYDKQILDGENFLLDEFNNTCKVLNNNELLNIRVNGTSSERPNDAQILSVGGLCKMTYYNKDYNKIEIPVAIDGAGNVYWEFIDKILLGTSDKRPSFDQRYAGTPYFDTTLNKPIWWTGYKWVDATGVDV